MAIEFLPPPKAKDEPANGSSEIQCRELTPEEIKKFIKPKFEATGNPLPNPSLASFIGVLIGGDVVASLCLQVKLHAQPLIIEEGYASVLPRLIAEAERTILQKAGPQWVYLFVPAGRLSQLATTLGMQLEPWNVMSKLVAPEMPNKIALIDPFNEADVREYQRRDAEMAAKLPSSDDSDPTTFTVYREETVQ